MNEVITKKINELRKIFNITDDSTGGFFGIPLKDFTKKDLIVIANYAALQKEGFDRSLKKENEQWLIAKEFALDYGHRVWTQQLKESHALCATTKCRHLHGHRGTVIVWLVSDTLDNQGMVTDFKHLDWFKKFLDDLLDHKFIIDKNDPLLPVLLPHFPKRYFTNDIRKAEGYWDVGIQNAPVIVGNITPVHASAWNELYEGFIVVDFVPTSENISKWLYNIVSTKMEEIDIKVHSVQWYETPKSQTIYKKG